MTRTACENRIDGGFVAQADTPQRSRGLPGRRGRTGGEDLKRGLRARLGAPLNALASVAIVAVVAIVGVLAGTSFNAMAQTMVLLSNNLQENADVDPYLSVSIAQAFTTGPEVRGYALESIELRVTTANNLLTAPPSVTVNQASGRSEASTH